MLARTVSLALHDVIHSARVDGRRQGASCLVLPLKWPAGS